MALPVRKKMLPWGNRNHPKTYMNADGDLYILVHETGNTAPGADAEMHAVFVYNGGGSSSVSFHLTVDQVEAYQMLPFNVIGWHASDGCNNRATDWGCFASVAIETCVNDGNRYKDTTRRNLAILIYMILTGDPALDFGGIDHRRFSVDRIKTHNDSADDRKWCPTSMLNEGYVPTLRTNVRTLLQGATPAPVYTIGLGDTVRATAPLNVRRGAGTSYPVVTTVPADTTLTIIEDDANIFGRLADGYLWHNVQGVFGTGWAASDWLERVKAAPPPPPAPTYAPARVVSELAALKKEDRDTVTGLVLKNGVNFFTVWDEVEAIRETPVLQYAYDGAKEIAPKAKPGDRRWVSHAFTADNGKGYYYDEHAGRLLMADWKRVSD